MIIDIKKTTIGIKLKKRVLILFLIVAATVFLIFNFYHTTYLGITGLGYIFILSGIWLIYLAWGLCRDYTYFYFTDQSLKLVFRFYSITSFVRKPNSVEIKKTDFVKFEVTKKFMGLRKYLILYQSTAKGVAKYPPISISLLKKAEEKNLSDSLSKLGQK
jgi:hypothetical protein